MAFGLNIDFSGVIGNLTNNLKTIAASKIQNLSSTVRTNLINTATSSLLSNLQSVIGTSLNLNLSKLTGGINFANGLKGLPFPSLSSLNLNAIYGLIDNNIGANLNKFAKSITTRFKNLSLDDISLGDKLNASIDNLSDNISNEIEAGIIVGKSSIDILGNVNKLSNTQIRDFTFSPDKQLAFVNNLAQQQKDKIFNLSFNGISETSIFDNQISNISLNSTGSFIKTTNPDFSFFDVKTIDEATISRNVVSKQQSQIANITQVKNPLARKIDLINRYNKEEETLNYMKTLNDDFNLT
tara:strand:+ start:825 stop:1715 length:891 start_codon:yes stop_codon:yes gene_type:complete